MTKQSFSISHATTMWLILMIAVGCTLVLSPAVKAQEATGRIIGTVTDPKGAVIPGAKVTATNVSNLTTQVTREALTDNDGNYQIPSLPIGTYRVSIERTGFKTFVSEDNKLQINQSLKVDAALEVGTTTERVEVVGTTAAVETVNPTLGQSVTSRPIVNLPLNGRNVLQLALLQPGVTETNPSDSGGGSGFNVGLREL